MVILLFSSDYSSFQFDFERLALDFCEFCSNQFIPILAVFIFALQFTFYSHWCHLILFCFCIIFSFYSCPCWKIKQHFSLAALFSSVFFCSIDAAVAAAAAAARNKKTKGNYAKKSFFHFSNFLFMVGFECSFYAVFFWVFEWGHKGRLFCPAPTLHFRTVIFSTAACGSLLVSRC